MKIMSNELFKVLAYNVNLLNVKGDVFNGYPDVISGYIFHYTVGNPLIISDESNFKFHIDFDWKKEISGSLEELQIKLEKFKNELLVINKNLYDNIDQFASINLFIVHENNQYELIISSDTFDVSELINLD